MYNTWKRNMRGSVTEQEVRIKESNEKSDEVKEIL
jgi:hypothetical protein